VFVLRIPDGTLIFPYFLYVLLSAKSKRVFMPDYREIIAVTPQIGRPQSIVVWTVVSAVTAEVALQLLRVAVRGVPH
jgi:hypothetical protein